ncbi:MAG: hypothetical protein NPINA01_07700 [Nitrospinaceae bacterium]|nr:MAG: hypothetical protein NPINA01_07700 [Nitrospinaceae bacterium]
MINHPLPLRLLLILLIGFSSSVTWADTEPEKNLKKGISPEAAANYIHSVIEAGRTIYSEVIVERLGVTIDLKATENWKEEDTLPLPAQFLLLSSRKSNARQVGMTYRLMSLWPINEQNGPKTQFEKTGLEEILKTPGKPFTRVVSIQGKPFFKAIYPDKAVTKTCILCHNNHPKSPKKNFKLGDVLGGISIALPLNSNGSNKGKHLIPAEVVADYIHSVLESDRQVYSEHVVNRLQLKNIVFASENWWEDNALLLPAQFLLNASDLILNKNIDLDFKLISPWPINSHNGPANEFEQRGLKYIIRHPVRPFIEYREIGGRNYFQAVYPDFAVSPACVSCHNNHPESPKRDFKLNDVMGGIVMTLPLE